MRKLVLNTFLLSLLAAAGYLIYDRFIKQGGKSANYTQTREIGEKAWPVRAILAERENHAIIRAVFGEINKPRVTQLSFQIAGCLETVSDNAKVGRFVKKGELLGKLDVRDIEHDIESAVLSIEELLARQEEVKQQIQGFQDLQVLYEEQLSLAQASFDRQDKLSGQGVTSARNIDEAKQKLSEAKSRLVLNQNEQRSLIASLNSLQKQIAIARERLKSSELRLEHAALFAPHNGKVDTTSLMAGACVSPMANVTSLIDMSETEVILELPIRIYRQLINNNLLEQAVEIFSGELVLGKAKIIHVLPKANDTTGFVKLHLAFESDFTVISGQQVQARLIVDELRHVVRLPISALFASRYVYKIEGSRLQEIGVEPVHQTSDGFFVSDKVKIGDLILTSHIAQAAPGLLVEVLEAGDN